MEDSEAGTAAGGGAWSVERRFRLTEVFLAVLWVRCCVDFLDLGEGKDWRLGDGIGRKKS